MKRAGLAAALALSGCGDGASTAPAATAAATSPDPAAASRPARQIGSVSGLSAQTSALTGAVSDFAVERTATETRVALAADTLFAFDKAELTPAAEANLTRTAELVQAGGSGTVRVLGYTDAKGEDAYNRALSRRRAEAVIAWLRGRPELSVRDFEAVGMGESDPVAPNAAADGSDDPAGRARNRRVVVAIPR